MGAVSGDFEWCLAEQESPAVVVSQIESETRRGGGYVRIAVSVEVSAPDVAQALTAAWSVFRQAASDDTAGWDRVLRVGGVVWQPCGARVPGGQMCKRFLSVAGKYRP